MTATFQSDGIHFLYPENWRLVDREFERLPYEISLESPQGSVWTLYVYPAASDATRIAEDILQALSEQYDSLESDVAEQEFAGMTAAGYDARFFCLDLLIEVQIRYFETAEFSLVLFAQAEDRDFLNDQLVFSAITTSLIRNLSIGSC